MPDNIDIFAHATRYIAANIICHKHRCNLLSRIRRFVEWNQEPIAIHSLSADLVNQFLLQMEDSGLSPHTVNGYRATILAVWRFAIGDRPPGIIRRARTPTRPVEGWNLEEIRQLCALAGTLRGRLSNNVRRRCFWLTAIHVGYSTGQRYGDLSQLAVERIGRNRLCTFTQSKTGNLVTVRFSEKAMRLIQRHSQPIVLPNPHTQKWFCEHFSRLVERAGIRGGSYKWLRRTSGSYADLNGRGPELLGNTRQVFNASYRVAEICQQDPPEIPEL